MTPRRKPKRKGAKATVKPEPCRHPITRRIGRNCAACGQPVKAKP